MIVNMSFWGVFGVLKTAKKILPGFEAVPILVFGEY